MLSNHVCICENKSNACLIDTTNKKLSVFGKPKSKTNYIVINTNQTKLSKFIVDDCLLKEFGREQKCDYLFLYETINNKIATFIEMKGGDIIKAINQINSSINILQIELQGYEIQARIISTKVFAPNLISAEFKKLKEKIKK